MRSGRGAAAVTNAGIRDDDAAADAAGAAASSGDEKQGVHRRALLMDAAALFAALPVLPALADEASEARMAALEAELEAMRAGPAGACTRTRFSSTWAVLSATWPNLTLNVSRRCSTASWQL
jgi:hypothetical protein